MTSSGGGRPRVRMTGAERRQQLLDVGRELFGQRGYEATSIEEVAARADVSKPVVYEHFGGKEGLYAVVVDREIRTLLDASARVIRWCEQLGWAYDVRWPDRARLAVRRS